MYCQGIVGDRPVMRINGHTFVGQYEDTLGTYLIMEKKDVDEQGSKGNSFNADENGTQV